MQCASEMPTEPSTWNNKPPGVGPPEIALLPKLTGHSSHTPWSQESRGMCGKYGKTKRQRLKLEKVGV